MPNSYFQFKQFTVHQEQSAMKVCTDSCLFGAWSADYLGKNKSIKRILDMGAGTGLLSLMLAQQCDANIDAVEIDEASANETKQNFLLSPWQERLHCYKERIQDFQAAERYDFIISNPPFYENDLLGKNKSRNVAHHNKGLSLRELMIAIKRLLNDEGSFAVLLPYHRTEEVVKMANAEEFFVQKQTLVKQTPEYNWFRSMNLFSAEKHSFTPTEICIKNTSNYYTNEAISLLKEYYLYL